ncbi:hypothetical protein C5N14_20860 [Micromonospora sp. MW-13]|uniref:DUF2188 domain-containing protein n=1 Tax=unclassified Micromonospora TaxID=2617518 RepID=UPI000E430907|nr:MULTISPECIES: DUF2188 domain-containing protein [unclassified Micromonospora]MCX4471813.1 DUF2188 domain-containing protein [Micromonospora sp. NBC_01655]RGC66907.1 hypothetical protein C5N14_20860 [Micromonospora sp. MW-13]
MVKGDIDTYHEDGQWKTRPEGNQQASSTHDAKDEAQARGREMAVDRGVEHVIKKQDGTIGEKNTYPRSRDPRDIKG